jgi:hypothetical protein
MSDAPEITELEAALIGRLGDVAATTVVDAGAWDEIQSCLTAKRERTRPTRRQVVAVAAAVVVALCAVVLSRPDGGSRVDTVDQSTTVPEGATTSTTAADRDTTASTGASGDSSTAGSQGSGPGSGTQPGENPTGTAGPGSPTQPGGRPATTTTSAPGSPAPSGPFRGYPVGVSFSRPGYTVNLAVHETDTEYVMDVWRDDSEYLISWGWWKRQGRTNCLGGVGDGYEDGTLGDLHWGMVRADAAAVRIVAMDGTMTYAVLGSEFAPGIRPWIGEEPVSHWLHYEALDAEGNILHSANTDTVWDAYPDTC